MHPENNRVLSGMDSRRLPIEAIEKSLGLEIGEVGKHLPSLKARSANEDLVLREVQNGRELRELRR